MDDTDDTLRDATRHAYNSVADLILDITIQLDTLKGQLTGLTDEPPIEALVEIAHGIELLRSASRGFRVASMTI